MNSGVWVWRSRRILPNGIPSRFTWTAHPTSHWDTPEKWTKISPSELKRSLNNLSSSASSNFRLLLCLTQYSTPCFYRAEYRQQALIVPFHFPLQATDILTALGIFAVPTFGAWFLARFWLNPQKDRQRRRYPHTHTCAPLKKMLTLSMCVTSSKVAKIREETAQKRIEKRGEAQVEQDLMKYSCERKVAEETAKRGTTPPQRTHSLTHHNIHPNCWLCYVFRIGYQESSLWKDDRGSYPTI